MEDAQNGRLMHRMVDPCMYCIYKEKNWCFGNVLLVTLWK